MLKEEVESNARDLIEYKSVRKQVRTVPLWPQSEEEKRQQRAEEEKREEEERKRKLEEERKQ